MYQYRLLTSLPIIALTIETDITQYDRNWFMNFTCRSTHCVWEIQWWNNFDVSKHSYDDIQRNHKSYLNVCKIFPMCSNFKRDQLQIFCPHLVQIIFWIRFMECFQYIIMYVYSRRNIALYLIHPILNGRRIKENEQENLD